MQCIGASRLRTCQYLTLIPAINSGSLKILLIHGSVKSTKTINSTDRKRSRVRASSVLSILLTRSIYAYFTDHSDDSHGSLTVSRFLSRNQGGQGIRLAYPVWFVSADPAVSPYNYRRTSLGSIRGSRVYYRSLKRALIPPGRRNPNLLSFPSACQPG